MLRLNKAYFCIDSCMYHKKEKALQPDTREFEQDLSKKYART
jgi:hypothetical protein